MESIKQRPVVCLLSRLSANINVVAINQQHTVWPFSPMANILVDNRQVELSGFVTPRGILGKSVKTTYFTQFGCAESDRTGYSSVRRHLDLQNGGKTRWPPSS